MTLQEVKSFFESNKDTDDVKSFLAGLNQVSNDTVKAYLETDEGKKYLQPILDKTVTKAIDTFKDKTLPGLVDTKLKELHPEMTAEQKQLKEMQIQLEKMKQETNREKLLNKALTLATEKNLPTQFVDKFLGEDEETTIKNIEGLSSIFDEHIKKVVEGKLPELGRTPETTSKKTNMSQSDLAKASVEDFVKYAPEIKL